MTNRTQQLTPLDRRVASGLKVMATGPEALAMTMSEVRAKGWLARGACSCGCGKRAFIDPKMIEARGLADRPLSDVVAKMKNGSACGGSIVLEVVDPWRDNLAP